jgi:dynein heavy chain
MDDNKMLTLVSNERIPLTPAMRLLFEISNLDNATPATVSRAGILFINAKDVGSKPFLDSWIERRENDKEKSSLLALFNKYTTPEFLHEMMQFARIIPVGEVNMIRTLCYLLEGLLARISDGKKKKMAAPGAAGGATAADVAAAAQAAEMSPAVEKELFEANFVYACIWAFGGATLVDKAADHRKEFSDWWRRVFTTIKFPKEGHVFDYFPDPKTGKMVPWSGVLPEWNAPDDAYLVTKVFVPTLETVRQHSLLDLFVERRRQVLLVGSAGTGKTVQVDQYLHSMNENMMFCTINLNYYTSASALQHIMEGPIDKRSGRIFGPPGNKHLVYFIDDLNMPQVDIYNTQSPSCLLKQHMDYGSWYDTSKLEKKEVQDVQYLAAMNPTAGSFTVDPRLQGLFATFACLLPSKKTLSYIYTSVLTHHFTPFGAAILEMVPKLIKATIELHDSVALKFIPSTRKFHYNFNLRDLSAVFQGCCLAQSGEGYTPKMIAQLWQHETLRVFSDRLVSPADEQIFEQLQESKLKQYFKDQLVKKAAPSDGEGGAPAGGSEKKGEEAPPLIFTSFMAGATPVYLPAENMAELKQVLEDKLSIYNDSNPVMNLEMFSIAIQHVCRIARIIENPRGNALMVGVGGSGKQSLAKLASFICGYDVFQISVTQSYGLPDLRVDLQNLYLKAGTKGIPISFLLTDTQIVDDAWLVYINDFLSSGNIPDLFNAEDKDSILSSIRNEAKAAGVADSREAMYEFFINNVRTNLHMILCFSPVGDKFRVRCRKFPALINCSVIDFVHPWERNALVAVGKRFLLDLDTTMGKAPQGANQELVQAQLAEHMAEVHLSVNEASEQYRLLERRYNYTTPKSFLELIAFYKTLLNKKRADLAKQTSRLEKGIQTLKQTHVQVAGLKEDLTKTLVRVGEKAEAATVLIGKMGVERKKVEEQQGLAAIEAAKAKTVSEVANKISEECREDLEKALPILERAKNAVDCLSKASLTTLKSFAQPPGNVIFVTNGTFHKHLLHVSFEQTLLCELCIVLLLNVDCLFFVCVPSFQP